jgi:hypothetical protein
MEKGQFLRSLSGRIAQGTTGLLIALAGVLAILGPGPINTMVPLAIVLGYIGLTCAVGFAVQDFWAEALTMLLTMPLVFSVYFAALYFVAGRGSGVGVALIVVGLVVGAPSLAWRLPAESGRPAHAAGH